MKKLIGFFVLIMVLASASCFAASKMPLKPGSQAWYLDKPYTACKEFGDPFVPNAPTVTLSNGTQVANPNYDAKKPTYDKAKWDECATPWYAYARECFKREGNKQVPIACTTFDPSK